MTIAAVVPDPTFIDANIFVFANTLAAPFHSVAKAKLHALNVSGVELCISMQICREYLATLSRPQFFGMPIPASVLASVLASDIRRFESQYRVLEDGPSVMANFLAFLAAIPSGGKQIHDANIVATMQAHGISRILTHNVADFTRFSNLIPVLTI